MEALDKPTQPPEEISVEVVGQPTGPVVWKTPPVYQIDEFAFQQSNPHIPLEVLDAIREKFEREVGVGEIPPTDPEYAERWKHAEPSALERMRTLFGWAAVAEFERKAVMESLAADSGSGKN